jgi:uncharacterized membrane protein
LAAHIVELLSGLPREWIVIIISAIPIIELRGAIPIGILLLGLPPWETFLLAMIGNIAPVPFILLLLNPVRRIANHWPLVGPILRWAEGRATSRQERVERYGFWGLIAFVGIPLPGTGAWTGSFVAVLLRMSVWRAFLAIALGVVTAGLVIALLSAGGMGLVR